MLTAKCFVGNTICLWRHCTDAPKTCSETRHNLNSDEHPTCQNVIAYPPQIRGLKIRLQNRGCVYLNPKMIIYVLKKLLFSSSYSTSLYLFTLSPTEHRHDKMENTVHLSLSLLTVIFLMAATWYAYNEGYMNPLIEKVGVFMMRARAEAEAKEMQAKGLKEGGGLLDCELLCVPLVSSSRLSRSLSDPLARSCIPQSPKVLLYRDSRAALQARLCIDGLHPSNIVDRYLR